MYQNKPNAILQSDSSIESGIATGGSQTTLVDSTKSLATDAWKGALIEIIINEVSYIRTVVSNTANTITFATLPGTITVVSGNDYNLKLSLKGIQTTADAIQVAAEAIKAAVEILDNAISGAEMQVDIKTQPDISFPQATAGKAVLTAGAKTTVKNAAGYVFAIKTALTDLIIEDGTVVIWKNGYDSAHPFYCATSINLTSATGGNAYIVYK